VKPGGGSRGRHINSISLQFLLHPSEIAKINIIALPTVLDSGSVAILWEEQIIKRG